MAKAKSTGLRADQKDIGPWFCSVELLNRITALFATKPLVVRMNQITLDMLRFSVAGGWDGRIINGAELELDSKLATGEVAITGGIMWQ